jgi:hypothetical protein
VVTITTSGHPYRGLTLTVPSGTFPSTATWTMQERTDLTLPALPSGYRVGGPLLEITTDAPRGGALMTLDVPIQRPAGEGLVLAFYDPARRIMEVLPTVAQTAASTRVVTTHLRADLLTGRQLAGLMALHGSPGSSTGVLVPIAFSLPQPPAQAAFNPATDQWPVVDYSAADEPNGFSGILSLFQMVAKSSGTNLSTVVKPLATAGFYADAGAIGTLIEGNALIQSAQPQLVAMHAQIGAQSTADEFTAQNVTAQIAMTGQPTMLAHYNASTGPVAGDLVYTNPVSSSGNAMNLVRSFDSPSNLTRASATFESHQFDAMYKPAPTSTDRVLYTPGFIQRTEGASLMLHQLKTLNALSGDARAQKNEEIATRAGLQKPALELESAPGGGWYPPAQAGAEAVRGDNLSVRLTGGTEEFSVHDFDSGVALEQSTGPSRDLDPYAGPTNGNRTRLVMVKVRRRRVPNQQSVTRMDIERARFRASPDSVRITPDSLTARFDVDVPLPPDAGFQVEWDWGDGTVTREQNTTTGTHQYAGPGDYTVRIRLRSAAGFTVYAVDSARVVSDVSPHWRLTSMQNPDELDLSVPIPLAMALQRAIASPNSAMIAVDAGLSPAEELSLRVKVNGGWNASNCCGTLSGPVAGELRELLGVAPSQAVAVGQVWQQQGYVSNQWSQSTADLGAGGIVGQYLKGSSSYLFDASTVSGPAQQTGPEYVLRISATRNGTAMSGTISFLYWDLNEPIPGETERWNDVFPTIYNFPFTAVRLK